MASKLCDSCKSATATVFCRADSAFLCVNCDTKIHAANKLASRHARVWVCEVCEQAPAHVTCKADAAALCVTCDRDIHSANPLARRHERVPVTPFYDSVDSSAVKQGNGGVVNFLDEDRYLDHVDGGSGDVSREEAEAASWLLPIPKVADLNTGQAQEPYVFPDMDPYLDLDYGHVDPKLEAQEQNSSGTDGVVPVQTRNVNANGHLVNDACFPSSPASGIAPNGVSLNGHMSDQWVDDSEVDDINMGVVVSPDYVFFRDKFCLGYLVVFSCTGIKIKDSNACGVQESFTFEKGIDDIVDIKFQWLQRFGSVEVKLHVISNNVAQDDNACGTSGIEELKFSFSDCNWSEQLEKITSLNAKYLALWSVDHDNPVDMDGVGQKRYFPNFDEPFEDVVYPEGDSDAVSISKRDIDLLQPDTFVNDTIIDFYIKYLKNQIQAEEKHRFHFFNSFFFRKLADLDKDPSSISDGKAAFLRVRKWTRKVDIFGKDYIFIPVNFNLHWSLIVICHPGDVASFKVEDLKRSEKVPCILHMDSIKGTHAGLKKLVQSYLCEEWKERHKDTSEDVSSKFLNLRFIPLELPQQENSFDCGLFLLHYLELFLAEAPVSFSPLKLKKLSSFLNVDWFPPGEASLKRSLIQKLISELLRNRSRVCLDEHQSSRFLENSVNEMRLEFLSEKCSAATAQHGNLSNSQAGQGVEITLLGATSGRNLQCANDSSLVLKELLEPGVTAGSLLAYQSFGEPSSYYHLNGAASAREQDVETAEEYGYLAAGSNGFQQITELTPQVGSISFPSRDFGTEASWNPEICMQGEQDVDSSDLSGSDDSEDVGIIENGPFVEEGGHSLEGRTDQPRSLSMDIGCFTEGPASVPSEMLQTLAVGGPEVPDQMHDRNDCTDIPSCHENPSTSLLEDSNLIEQRLSQDSDTIENREVDGDYAQVTDDNLQTQPYEQQAAKRLRLTPREGED